MRIQNRYAGAKIIEVQLEERKKQRIKEAEARRIESEEMRKVRVLDRRARKIEQKIEILKKDNEEAVQKKKEIADHIMAEVAKSNREQIRRKEETKQQEKEEERKILEYIKQKEIREQATFIFLCSDA